MSAQPVPAEAPGDVIDGVPLPPVANRSHDSAAVMIPVVAPVPPSVDEETSRHVERLTPSPAGVDDHFERITALAASLFGVPLVTVSLLGDIDPHQGASARSGLRSVVPQAIFGDLLAQSRRMLVVEDATTDPVFAGLGVVTGPPYLRFLAGVPLEDEDGVVVGAFCLFDTVPRRLDRGQSEMLRQLAAWARRELVDSNEMARARIVQESLLPRHTVAPEGYELAGACHPTKSVGGDFYDHAMIDGHLVLALMDVMGKGVGAALVAASVRAVLRASVLHHSELAARDELSRHGVANVINATDTLVAGDLVQTGTLVTGFAALLEPATGKLVWVDAGHGLAVVIRADGTADRLVSTDLPLGLGLQSGWTQHTTVLEPGDMLLVVSDGLFELLGSTAASFDEGIRYLASADPEPAQLIERISELASLSRSLDDVTAIAVRRASASS